jgi:chromosomal replication initiator protein
MAYLDDIKELWETVKGSFSDSLSADTIELWFGKLKLVGFAENTLTMSTDSPFKYDIITTKYLDRIRGEFSRLLGFDIDVKLVCTEKDRGPEGAGTAAGGNAEAQTGREAAPQPSAQWGSTRPTFNFEYTFDNFIVGNSNRFAHAACTAVAAAPATNYNPLFIYGPSGLGKTHLLYAIVNEVKKTKADLSVIYIKAEDFTNQLIEAMGSAMTAEFRNKYRSCDLLLIDDIQFIAGKNSTQEEFFNTFNALYEDHKQIILTSDRPPREIKTLEERLKTRFEWGLLADIQPPDLELRIAIIRKKAEQVGITLGDDVLTFLAENLRSNIRQIEGAIKKLGATSFLTGTPVTLEVAQGCINDLLDGETPVSVTVDKIFAAVCSKYGVRREDLVGQKRTKEIAFARHVALFLIRSITDMSLPNIGKIFSRDHSTVLSSVTAIEKKLRTDPAFRRELEAMRKEVEG